MTMGGGEKSLKNFHLPHLHHQHHKKQVRDVPKGCLAIKVGQGEEQQRFVVPVIYFNHPLFIQLLKEAEEEYGFDQKGTITIPCHVEEFRYVQGMIDREKSIQHHHAGCFRELLFLDLDGWTMRKSMMIRLEPKCATEKAEDRVSPWSHNCSKT
ncbi:hypothetical protein SADUNF_Sadunf02G0147900 [Salix dunnii]|uniref:SAUR family protein n=1 Tax=Salix dunnii TaxID=1413687 RepID=A0A835TK98_9ROSI|nr:hypothetical protein SADUNF_Sadunf02G0147900 [Salix dunnii]